MNGQLSKVARFAPLACYAVGLAFKMITDAAEVWITLQLITAPFALGAPVSAVFIGRRLRPKRVYWLGVLGGILGVCSVLVLSAVTAVFWTSLGLNNNGDVEVTFAQALPMLLSVFTEGLAVMWPIGWGAIATVVYMTVCALRRSRETAAT